MVAFGLGLMLFGWRLWRVCVVLSFALIGAVIGATVAGPRDDQWFYALIGAAVLGTLSYWPAKYAVAVLGGVIGGGFLTCTLADLGMRGFVLWGAGAAVFVACTAYAYLNRQRVIVFLTSFLGATLLLSGVTAWAMAWPGLFGTFKSMATGSAIVLPFLVLVPTVMSCLYQMSEVHRLRVEQ